MDKKLNKWQIGIKIGRRMDRMDNLGWKQFQFYILKFISFPPEGEWISEKNYNGFWLKFMFWLPIDL